MLNERRRKKDNLTGSCIIIELEPQYYGCFKRLPVPATVEWAWSMHSAARRAPVSVVLENETDNGWARLT